MWAGVDTVGAVMLLAYMLAFGLGVLSGLGIVR